MNNDLISRSELKKAYFNAINETSIGEVSIIDLIDNAPTVKTYCYFCGQTEHGQIEERPQGLPENNWGEWIPVSERLPEDRNLVLVTAYWHETYQVMQASYFGEGEKNGWWCVPWNNCGEHTRNDLHVIAWRPLPKPYKEGGKEE